MHDRRIESRTSLLLALALAAPPTWGQAEDTSSNEELERRLTELEERYERDMDALEFEIDGLMEELDERANPPPVTRAKNVFNPLISVVGTLLGRADDRIVTNLEGDEIDDTLRLSEVEVDLRSAIDPWADGVMILSIESPLPGVYETSIEEGYVVLKKLPFLDSAPAGLRIRAGRLRASFGRINKVHTHNLPWSTRPLPVREFLGEEGYLREGLSGSFHLPAPSDADSVDLTLEVLAGGAIPIDEDAAPSDFATVGHLAWFRELTTEHTVEAGLSARGGDSDRLLLGADFTYTWKPLQAGQWRSFLLGGEYFLIDSDTPDLDRPRGGFLWTQYQLGRSLYLGARHDWVEALDDSSIDTDRSSLWLSYYTTEFLRLRCGVEHTESDLSSIDGLDTAFVEMSFIFGTHPSDPYWVNR